MTRQSALIVLGAMLFTLSKPSKAQVVLRIERRQLNIFAKRIGGMDGAMLAISDTKRSKRVREAIADSVAAHVNAVDREPAYLSQSDALAILMLAAGSGKSDEAEIGVNRLTNLADLYAKQGLMVEAKGQYQIVVDEYKKRGKIRVAGEALRKMAEIDPDDLKIQSMLADL